MGGMDSKTLFLPGALADSPLGVLFLDKALKRARAEGLEVRGVTLPAKRLPDARRRNRFVAEAALNGLPCAFGETPHAEAPYQAFVGARALDLRLPAGLHDWHAHTQFAYCGRGIDLLDAARLALTLGVERQGFSEHAFALYFGPDALKFRWQGDAALVGRVWEGPGRGRMAAYRAWLADLRALLGPRVRFGLEVDLCLGGRLCLAPEDRAGWDYLIGAVHEVEGLAPSPSGSWRTHSAISRGRAGRRRRTSTARWHASWRRRAWRRRSTTTRTPSTSPSSGFAWRRASPSRSARTRT